MSVDPVVELNVIEQLRALAGGRLRSHDLCLASIDICRQIVGDPEKKRAAQLFMRIAIKAKPYASEIETMINEYKIKTQQIVRAEMPEVIDIVAHCEQHGLPLPVIMSCRKYLDRARPLAAKLKDHYFGIEPLLIIGGGSDGVQGFADGVLCLLADDNYEGLPQKVFEAYTLIDAIGAQFGILKIDDDAVIKEHAKLDLVTVRHAFQGADYMGVPIATPQHDRSYHLGKCATQVEPVYGKPFLAPFATGCLYYLSKRSLSRMTAYYLRFPGCLAGEIYEDKAVADVLYNVGIGVVDYVLEDVLEIETDRNE